MSTNLATNMTLHLEKLKSNHHRDKFYIEEAIESRVVDGNLKTIN